MIDTCLDCKNYVPTDRKVVGKRVVVSGVFEPIYKEVPRHCTKCNDVMQAWFKKYGNTPILQLTEDAKLPCLELKEHLKCLDRAIALCEDIIEKLNN